MVWMANGQVVLDVCLGREDVAVGGLEEWFVQFLVGMIGRLDSLH